MKHNPTKQVRAILERVPATRSNTMKLIAYVWAEAIGHENLHRISAKQLLEMMMNAQLPNPESIRRAKQRYNERKNDRSAMA